MIGAIGRDRRGRAILGAALGAALVALCGLPYLRWSAHPSLFDDDLLRVGSLRRVPLSEALFRPFNEHMAPLFEVVSWVAWRGSGRSVPAVPGAFLAASFAAFGASVALLWAVVRQESRSGSVAAAAVAAFALSAVPAEAVLWYSASSFQWAAASTLAAWSAAASAAGATSARRRGGWLAASAAAAACAPAFSAIGVLAGPLAALRLLMAGGAAPPARRLAVAASPAAGTALYLLACSPFRYGELVASSVGRHLDPVAALRAAARAPASVLIPGLVGLPEQSGSLPGPVAAGLTLAGLVLALGWAARSRDRPLILGGVALIAGGYLAAFATRARPGDDSIFQVGRYHLFPQLGLAWLVAAALAPGWRRLGRRPLLGLAASVGLAAALALVQYPRMRSASDRAFRYPEQPRAIEAALRLERACGREGITLIQAAGALEPIRTRWSPQPWPFHPLLHLFAAGPDSPRLPDPLVRPTLLAAMSPRDRESLFGGMEATRYRGPASAWDGPGPPEVARLASADRVTPLGAGRHRAAVWPCHLEFEVGPEADSARALCLPGLKIARALEVWWSDGLDGWSPYRSVRWAPGPGGRGGEDGAVPLDLLPHWRRGGARRIRLVFRESGEVAVGAPRFLR